MPSVARASTSSSASSRHTGALTRKPSCRILRSSRGAAIEYRGVTLEEMDVEAILARKPQLCVVDELAHTNAPGGRHDKRYQDVLDLLDAGIGVLTAVNIQHLETLNDAVSRVTGVRVRETVPDTFLDRADEVVNVDVTVQELQTRLRQGKVYKAGESRAGAREFLQRDESLYPARTRAARGRRRDRREGGVAPPTRGSRTGADSRTRDGLYELECRRSASPPGRRSNRWPARRPLVRRLRRNAARSTGTYQTCRSGGAPAQHRAREDLGATIVRVKADKPADGLIAFAKREGITHVIFGQSARTRWEILLKGSTLNRFLEEVRDAAIQVVPLGEPDA